MKTTTLILTALVLLPPAIFCITSCSSTSEAPPPAESAILIYKKGVHGGVKVQTFQPIATVTAIDKAKRKATLLQSDGMTFIVKVAREAVNFDQIRVGDQVEATVTERIVVSLDKKNAPPDDGTADVAPLAPKGDQPGRLVTENTQITAKVVAIDAEKRTAILRFEDAASKPSKSATIWT